MEKLIYTEQKQLNNPKEYVRKALLSLLAAISSVMCCLSSFGITFDFGSLTFVKLGGQLANLLNEMSSWMLIRKGFVFKELASDAQGYAGIVIVMIALLTIVNMLILLSNKKKMTILTVLPILVTVLITEGEISIPWLMCFTALTAAMVVEIGNDQAGLWNFIYLAATVSIAGVLISASVTGSAFDKSQIVEKLDDKIQKTATELYYGKNLLDNGNVTKENRETEDEQIALKVQMSNPQSTYLRGFVGEIYTGGKWNELPSGAYKETKNLLYWLEKEGFNSLGQMSQADSLTGGKTTENQMSVQVENANSKHVYVPYEFVKTEDEYISKYGSYLTEGNVGRANEYTITTRDNSVKQWTDTAGRFYTFEDQKKIADYITAESYYNQMAYEYYTYVSADDKKLLKEYFGDWGNQSEGHIEYSKAIENVMKFLDEKTYYTESPAMENSEKDPLETFLAEGKGYDVHCATAATLMFRYYGIPARYVEGYLVTPEDVAGKTSEDIIEIPRSNNHAWVEIYVDGIGFVPLEVSSKYKGIMEEADLTKGIENQAFMREFENSQQKMEGLQSLENQVEEKGLNQFLVMVILVLLGLLLLLVLLAVIYKVLKKKVADYKRKQFFEKGEPKKAVCAIYEYMEENNMEIEAEAKEIGNKAAFSKKEITEEERSTMLNFLKKASTLMMAVIVTFTMCGCSGNKAMDLTKETETAAQWVLEATPSPCVGSIGGDWAVKGVLSSGLESDELNNFLNTYKDDVNAQVKLEKGNVDEEFYTTYARIAIGAVAAGEDPKNIQGYNLVEKLDNYDKLMEQNVIGSAYALIGANVSDYTLKNEDRYVDFLVKEINEQKLYEMEVWTDVVAMAVEALSYYDSREDVSDTIEKCVNGLSDLQGKDGSFGNCESTAEVIIALTMAGIDPMTDERFIKNGNSLGESLLLYKGDGQYLHIKDNEGGNNYMSTEKALLALSAMKLQSEGEKLF